MQRYRGYVKTPKVTHAPSLQSPYIDAGQQGALVLDRTAFEALTAWFAGSTADARARSPRKRRAPTTAYLESVEVPEARAQSGPAWWVKVTTAGRNAALRLGAFLAIGSATITSVAACGGGGSPSSSQHQEDPKLSTPKRQLYPPHFQPPATEQPWVPAPTQPWSPVPPSQWNQPTQPDPTTGNSQLTKGYLCVGASQERLIDDYTDAVFPPSSNDPTGQVEMDFCVSKPRSGSQARNDSQTSAKAWGSQRLAVWTVGQRPSGHLVATGFDLKNMPYAGTIGTEGPVSSSNGIVSQVLALRQADEFATGTCFPITAVARTDDGERLEFPGIELVSEPDSNGKPGWTTKLGSCTSSSSFNGSSGPQAEGPGPDVLDIPGQGHGLTLAFG